MFFNKLTHNSIKKIIGKYLFDYKGNIIDQLFSYREIYDKKYILWDFLNRSKEINMRKYNILSGLNLYFDLYGYNNISDLQIKNILMVGCGYNHVRKIVDSLSHEKKEELAYWVIINSPYKINLFKGLDPMKLYEYHGEDLTLFEIAQRTNVDYSICYLLFYSGIHNSPLGKLYKNIYYYVPAA
jgi:hypothetical protein